MKSAKIRNLVIVVVVVLLTLAGCKSRTSVPEIATPATPPGLSSSSKLFSEAPPRAPSSKPDGETIADAVKAINKLADVKERKAQNSDTVGWINIPELGISDVVVCNIAKKDAGRGPNMYYERKNFAEQDYYNGVLYADYRSTFGSGASTEISYNTVIYGHCLTDDSTKSNYEIFFAPLHDLRDEEMAKGIPYIFFTTEKENLAFEVFFAGYINITTQTAPYNTTDFYSQAEFAKFVRENMLSRSIFDYTDIEIKDTDKFLTLSTCGYNLPDGGKTYYPDTWYRYVVMGRLVSPDEPLKKEASITKNEDMILDDNKDHTAEFWSHLM